VSGPPTEDELRAANCWEAEDRVPGRPAMTAFRQAARLHQARWREAHGHPIGSQPIVPRAGGAARPVGSRMPFDHARETGANLLTPAALEAARTRTSFVEPHQSFDHQRLWADLLWSSAFAFNMFGDLAADLGVADRAVHTWWPDAPGTVREVRFAHAPGRLDPAWTGSLVDFATAFVLDLGDGSQGIVGLEVVYHERAKGAIPKPTRLARYREIAERSGVFAPDGLAAIERGDQVVTWLHHLLVHAMLQHPSGAWRWGRFALVRPSGNVDYADVSSRYEGSLSDRSTFSSLTLEQVLQSGALPRATAASLRERYLIPS
jgi:hypothetical protein